MKKENVIILNNGDLQDKEKKWKIKRFFTFLKYYDRKLK